MREETPVNAEQARHVLGGSRPCSQCGGAANNVACGECRGKGEVATPWSRSYMSAVKKAMGVKGRYFFLSDVRTFIRENPDFKSKDSTFEGDTFRGLLEEALDYLRQGAPPKLVQRIERKLA